MCATIGNASFKIDAYSTENVENKIDEVKFLGSIRLCCW